MGTSGQRGPGREDEGRTGSIPAVSLPGAGHLPPSVGEPTPEPPPTQQFALAAQTVRGPAPATRRERQQTAEPDGGPVPDGLLATSALLTVQRGGSGARYLVNADRTTVGRHPGSDIFLDDATVSRSHAVLERRGTDYWVHDEGSLNGTYVNGERIETVRLVPGDQIQIGKFPMTFQQAAQPGSGSLPTVPDDGGRPGPGGPGQGGSERGGPGQGGSERGGPGPGSDSGTRRGGGPGWWRSLTARLQGRRAPRP